MWLIIIVLLLFVIVSLVSSICYCKHHKSKDNLDDVDLDIIRRSMDKDSGLDDDN